MYVSRALVSKVFGSDLDRQVLVYETFSLTEYCLNLELETIISVKVHKLCDKGFSVAYNYLEELSCCNQ